MTDMIPSGNDSDTVMSSREIAELCEKQHQHVRRDIENMLEALEINASTFGRIYQDTRNRDQKEYLLPKDLTLTLVSGYRVDLRYRIVKRVEEMEKAIATTKQTKPTPKLAYSKEVRLAAGRATTTGRAMGLDGSQLALFVNSNVRALTGHDFMAVAGITHLTAPEAEPLLTPSDIAKRLGIGARAVNPVLCDMGLQTRHRNHKDRIYYQPTDDGMAAGATMQDTGKRDSAGTPIRQLKWASGVIDILRDRMDSEVV